MNVQSIVKVMLAFGLSVATQCWAADAVKKPEPIINDSTVKIDEKKANDTLKFAAENPEFKKTAESILDRNAQPVALPGSDPEAVKGIIAREKAMEKTVNDEFATNPSAPLRNYVSDPRLLSYIDIMAPGQYFGDDVRKYFEFIGPYFIGRFELREMRVYAPPKANMGFVYEAQEFYGKDANGKPFQWIMRQTDVLIKEKGEWKIMHTHISFPVKNFDTGEADLLSHKNPKPWELKKGPDPTKK